VHLRHALELKPDLSDAADALKEVEALPSASVHVYTLLIIFFLVRKLIGCIYKMSYHVNHSYVLLIYFLSL